MDRMTTQRDRLDNEMFQTVCGMMYQHFDHLRREDWQKIFADALGNAFGDGTATDQPEDP